MSINNTQNQELVNSRFLKGDQVTVGGLTGTYEVHSQQNDKAVIVLIPNTGFKETGARLKPFPIAQVHHLRELASDNIPASLKSRPRWCLWKWKPVKIKDGTTKDTKVPVHAYTYRPIDATDLGNGIEFAACLAQYKKNRATGAAGIGFLLGDGIGGIDLDKVLDPTSRSFKVQWAQDAANLIDSYTEVSPSGRGVKILFHATSQDVLADDQVDIHNRLKMPDDMQVEFYLENRFFTITGDHLAGTPTDIRHREAEVADWYAETFAEKIAKEREDRVKRAANAATFSVPKNLTLDATKIMEVADLKVKELWYGGNLDLGDSEADASLASRLAFYAGPDPDLIESLMRQSKRCRPKWDDKRGSTTWIGMTIEKYMVCEKYYDWSSYDRATERQKFEEHRDQILHDLFPRNAVGDAQEPRGDVAEEPVDIRQDQPVLERTEPTVRRDYEPKDFEAGDEWVKKDPYKSGKVVFQSWDEVCSIADNQTEDWVIPGWMEFGCLHLFTGLPFSGKSTLVGEQIAAIAQGSGFHGMTCAQVPFILLDLENKERILVKRIRSCLGDDPGKINDLFFRVAPKDIKLPLEPEFVTDCIGEIKRNMKDQPKGIVWVDTFRSAFAAHEKFDEVNAACMVAILKPLKDLAAETGWAVVVLHHNAKHSNTYSGSTSIAGVADYLWNWQSNKETLEGKLSVEGRDDCQRPLCFKYDPEMRRNILLGTSEEVKTKKKDDKEEQTRFYFLKNFPDDVDRGITTDEAARLATCYSRTAVRYAKEEFDAGFLTRTGEGKKGKPHLYSLTDRGQDFVFRLRIESGI
jgi:hypothetical protein